MNYLSKKEASDHLGVTKQWMHYRTKKKGGIFPEYMNEDGSKVDADNELLSVLVAKQHRKVASKKIRGKTPEHEIERSSDKKKSVNKKVSKKDASKQSESGIKSNISSGKPPKVVDSDESQEQKDKEHEDNSPEAIEMRALVRKSERAKCEQDIHKAEKMKNDAAFSRGELVERSSLAATCFGYLNTLSKEIMKISDTVIQDVIAGIEAEKSKTELADILRTPCSLAIQNTKKNLQKELKKGKK